MVVWRRFLVAWIHFPVPWWRFMVAWIHFLDTWSWVHGCLVNFLVTKILTGALDLVPCLSGEGSWLAAFTFSLAGLLSMVAWWRFLVVCVWFLVAWTLVKWFLAMVPIAQVHFLVPWRFQIAWFWFLVACVWFLVARTWFHSCLVKVLGCLHSLPPWVWFHGWLEKVPGSLGSLPGSIAKVPGCLDSLLVPWLWFHGCLDLAPWVPREGSRLPGFDSWFPMEVFSCLDFIQWLPGEGLWLAGITAWFHGEIFLVTWIPWFGSTVAWTWFHGCLEKLHGCLDSLPGCLDLIPRLPSEGFWLPEFTSWFHGEIFLGTWIHFWFCGFGSMVAWTWFHGCLEKVCGCLDSLPDCLDFAPWLPGLCSMIAWWRLPVAWTLFHGWMVMVSGCLHNTSWLRGFGSMVVWIHCLVTCQKFLVVWIHFLVPWAWFHGCLAIPGCLDLAPWLPVDGSWLPRFTSCFPGLGSVDAWRRFLVAWIHFLVAWTWFHGC